MRVGILSVQGDFEAHARMLERLDVPYALVKRAEDVTGVDAMILPGGESTTMLKFLSEEGIEQPLRSLAERGGAFFGTCAGAILMAREVRAPAQRSLGFADVVVTRNAYGRQLASEVRRAATAISSELLEMVFIRAPIIEHTGPEVEVLGWDRGHPVLVRQRSFLMSTFHPELTDDTAVHTYFLQMARSGHAQRDRTLSGG
jgi:5'-phosphate synthase pdxT subunit